MAIDILSIYGEGYSHEYLPLIKEVLNLLRRTLSVSGEEEEHTDIWMERASLFFTPGQLARLIRWPTTRLAPLLL
jgi:hypothetical protein